MNRRSFLKLFGYTAVAVALPSFTAAHNFPELPRGPLLRSGLIDTQEASWSFDPEEMYGGFLELDMPSYEMPEDQKGRIFDAIEMDMRHFIPSDYWDKVVYIEKNPGPNANPFDTASTLAWKYKP